MCCHYYKISENISTGKLCLLLNHTKTIFAKFSAFEKVFNLENVKKWLNNKSG